MKIMTKDAQWKKGQRGMRHIAILCAVILSTLSLNNGLAQAGISADDLVNGWITSNSFKTEIQDFAAEGNKDVPYPELIVVSEADALQTAVNAVLHIESLQPDALADYTPSIAFKAIGTEYSYDVRLTPSSASAAARPFFIEVGASSADNMLRFHVLTDDGSETVSI